MSLGPRASRLSIYADHGAPAVPAVSRTISVDQAAAILGVSRDTVYRSIAADTFGARTIRVGRRVLVSRADVERFVGPTSA